MNKSNVTEYKCIGFFIINDDDEYLVDYLEQLDFSLTKWSKDFELAKPFLTKQEAVQVVWKMNKPYTVNVFEISRAR